MGEFEAWLEQSEQEKIVHSQEATQKHVELAELKIKQAELQDVFTLVAEQESALMERIIYLEANICSKTEEVIAA